MEKILQKISRFFLSLLVFLLPVFFLPFSFEFLEFNKIYLLLFFVLISLLLWLLKNILKFELKFKKVPFSIFLFLFFLSATLSAIFSVDKYFSIFGYYGRFSNGLLALFLLLLFYFLLVNNFEKENSTFLLDLFLLSLFFSILIFFFSLSGIFQKIFHFQILTPTGTFEGFSILLSFALILLTGLLTTKEEKIKIFFYSILSILVLASLIVLDFKLSFLLVIFSLVLFLIFGISSKIFREKINKLLLSIFFIFLFLFFLFFNPFSLPQIQNLREPILGQRASFEISILALKESLKSAIFGSGIGTFFYDFSKFKPLYLNNTLFWNLRFDRAGSHLAEILATMGIFGLLTYLIFVFSFSLLFLVSLFKKKEFFVFFLPFLTLFLAQILYYQNATLAFAFWFFFGLLTLNIEKTQEKKISFEKIPELSLLFNTFSILIFAFSIFVFYFAIRFYLADFYYKKAVLSQNGPEQVSLIQKALTLNPLNPQYRLDLARAHFARLVLEIQKPSDQQDQSLISNSAAAAINYLKGMRSEDGKIIIKGVSEISPNWVLGWENLGMVYREITSLVSPETKNQAIDWAIKSFERAKNLEPKNPVFENELGKLYLAKGEFQMAKEKFKKALDLSPPYFLNLAAYSLQADINFNLGLVYFNEKNFDQAISQFEKVISIVPNHSNSLYFLGLIFEEKGEKEKALEYFKKVLELNPENQVVSKKIEELEKKEQK